MAENTFINIGGHKVSAGKKYSTTEVKTGDVWIDGKPIYRISVEIPKSSLVGGGNALINIFPANTVSKIIKFDAVAQSITPGYDSCFPIPFCYYGSSSNSFQDGIRFDRAFGTIMVQLSTPMYTYIDILIVTIEYTKTTD